MASRIMHYTIACEVAKRISIHNKKLFLIGNLEPDIVDKKNGEYDRSHFGCESDSGTKGINWIAFTEKYRVQILKDDELLGYLSHLIADAYWLKQMRDLNIRKFHGEDKKTANARGYAEMRLYNRILIEKYQLKNEIFPIKYFSAEEVNLNMKDLYFDDLAKDFSETTEETQVFTVYPFEQVMDWLENTIRAIVCEIQCLRENRRGRNPEDFYVKK